MCTLFRNTLFGWLIRCVGWAVCALAPMVAQGACGPYRVAVYEHGVLYVHGADGVDFGLDKDVVEALAQRTGCTLHTALDSRVRIWAALESGSLEMSVSGIATPEREKFAHFVTYFRTFNNVLLRQDIANRGRTPERFVGQPDLRVAVVKSFKHGVQYDAWLDTLRALGRVEEVADIEGAYRLLKVGRVHAVLGLPTTWMPLLARDQWASRVKVLDWFPNAEPILAGMIFSRTGVRPEDFDRMSQALQAMRKDGTLAVIYQRYVGVNLARQMLRY